MICDKCGKEFERNVKIKGKVIENYVNIYGTRCPYCKHLVEPETKIKIVQENESKLQKLREEFLEKLRRKK